MSSADSVWISDPDDDDERENLYRRTGIWPLGRWRGRAIALDTEGARWGDLANNILATFEWGDKETIIRCGNAVVISSEMVVHRAPHDPRDVNFLDGVQKVEFCNLVAEFQKSKGVRWFFLRKIDDGFLVRRVSWRDAQPGDFS